MKTLLLIIGLALTSSCLAIDLDSLPEIADNSVCDLGRVDYMRRANIIAREARTPAPITFKNIWSVLSDYMLDSCSDNQILLVADSHGSDEFAGSAFKLLKRVCVEKDIVITKASENGDFAVKYSCPITKLNELRKALNRPPGAVSRPGTGTVAPGRAPAVSPMVLMAYDPYDKSPDNAPVEFIKNEYTGKQGGLLGSLVKVTPDQPVLNGIVTWFAYNNVSRIQTTLKKYCESNGSQWARIKPYNYDKTITREIMVEAQISAYKRIASIGNADVNVARDAFLQSFDEAVFNKANQAHPRYLEKLNPSFLGIYQCSSDAANYWFAAIIPGEFVGNHQEIFIQAIPRPKLANAR